MNGAHLHLLMNHAPLFGVLTGAIVLAAGMSLKSNPIQKTALCIFIVSALVTIPVYLTGDPAEHVLKNMPELGIKKQLIHEHEEAADLCLWTVIGLGILSVSTFLSDQRNKKFSSILYSVILVFSVVVLIGLSIVNNKGGMIRHSEINSTSTAATSGEKDDD